MAETVNELYLKYVNEVSKSLEDDRYFQYLFEMIQAGENEISQQRQILHKIVDERWLSTIEDALEPLNRIVEQPRRTIVRNEEVVPVSLAKKITADSVRHLSMNTQFIGGTEGGDIHPTHILNVSVDESYDLYENRFIYYLIQHLVTFIDKRADLIFWSTGDEKQNTFQLESKIDDAYETIEYKVEMKIKNLKNFAENDADNMDVFMRIDRVRRMVMALKNSSFCEIMAGCQMVKSPIQRTNLLTKDRDYRVCYALWQFLESYDEIGYTIEAENTALEIDEEYLIQMYTNLITNYAVFKSITESDKRDLDEAPKRFRKVTPKFVKEVVEEEIPDRNVPEVEIKKVFVEEVTQAQLDAEAKLAEEIKLREDTEEALRNAEASAHHSMIQAEYAQSVQQSAEEELEKTKKKLAQTEETLSDTMNQLNDAFLTIQQKDDIIAERDAQLTADTAALVKQIEDERAGFDAERSTLLAKIDAVEEDYQKRMMDVREECKERIEIVENDYLDKMDKQDEAFSNERDAIQSRNENELESRIEDYESKLSKQAEDYNKQIDSKVAFYEAQLDSQFEKYDASLKEQKDKFTEEMTAKDEMYTKQIEGAEAEHTSQIEALKKSYEEQIENLKAQAREEFVRMQSENEKAIEELKANAAAELAAANDKAAAEYDALKKDSDERYAALETSSGEKYAALETSSREAYEQLKSSSEKEIYETKKASEEESMKARNEAKAEVEKTASEARSKETELNSVIDSLKREKEMLEQSNAKLEAQLGQEMSARKDAQIKASESTQNADAQSQLKQNAESLVEKARQESQDAAKALKAETERREAAEKEVQLQKELLQASEAKVKATTVAEFKKALRAEQKLKKMAGK